jgi:hypothetical protein
MPTKLKTNRQKSDFIKVELNKTLSERQIKTIQEEKYFIPTVIEIYGVRIPSTPFYSQNGNPIFLGDVIEIQFYDDDRERYLVELKNGQYVGTCLNPNTEELLWLFDMEMINNLGSSLNQPELLNGLSA